MPGQKDPPEIPVHVLAGNCLATAYTGSLCRGAASSDVVLVTCVIICTVSVKSHFVTCFLPSVLNTEDATGVYTTQARKQARIICYYEIIK